MNIDVVSTNILAISYKIEFVVTTFNLPFDLSLLCLPPVPHAATRSNKANNKGTNFSC